MHAYDDLDERQRSQVKALHAHLPSAQCLTGVIKMVEFITTRRLHTTNISRVEYVELMFIMSTNQWKNSRPELDVSGLYLQLSRFNHSCVANTISHEVPSADGSQVRVVQARTDIQAGEEITVEYIRPWTENRAVALRQTWGFDCRCPLCDTSEDSTMDHATRVQYERMFQQMRDNDEEAFQGTASTTEQIITRHQQRVEALEFLGYSNELLNEYSRGVTLYVDSGDYKKLDEFWRNLYRVMTIVCDENDPYRLALQQEFSERIRS